MNLACRNYQEKRDFLRMKIETAVELVLEQQTAVHGICHDLSGGGMSVSADTAVQVGTQIEVTIQSNYGHKPMFKALTQVQRVQAQTGNGPGSSLLALKIVRVLE